jgi:hypothetical protein
MRLIVLVIFLDYVLVKINSNNDNNEEQLCYSSTANAIELEFRENGWLL